MVAMASLDLLGVFLGLVAQRLHVLMAEQGVAVEADLGVQHPQMAVGHDDQRIDLQHRHVLVDEGLVEDREQGLAVLRRRAGQAVGGVDLGHIGGRHAGFRIDVDGDDLVGRVVGDPLDVHAALGRNHEGHAAGRAVDQQGTVQFTVDVGAVLDVETVDLFAGGAGLGGHQRIAQHLPGVGHDLFDRAGQADAALGVSGQFLEPALAAPAGVDLGLHDIQGPGQLPRRGLGLIGAGDGDPFGHRCAKALQDLFGLVFVDVHGKAPPDCWGGVRRL
jgi:hypothetical protein